jgi:ubiquinone/menaquinone biosynthesis C-methylase UbiE
MENISALEAKYEAQKIAFGPIAFQAVNSLIKLGVLDLIHQSREGISDEDISKKTGISIYGIKVLLDLARFMKVVLLENNKNKISKIGYFLIKDKLTKVNFNFVNDVCYKGAFYLEDSIREEKPIGLHKAFGQWDTVYEALSELPENIRKSWFDFDHYYSDTSFNSALKIVFKNNPKKIMDIGGNTGKWSLKCTSHNNDVEMTIVDLPGQISTAKKNILDKTGVDRISFYPQNLLSDEISLPGEHDIIWMSQFLDCFSEKEIIKILKAVKTAMSANTKVMIMETFVDRQKYPAAEFSLHNTSLYFTCIANGNSRMYPLSSFSKLIEKAGLVISQTHDEVGVSHTILECCLP